MLNDISGNPATVGDHDPPPPPPEPPEPPEDARTLEADESVSSTGAITGYRAATGSVAATEEAATARDHRSSSPTATAQAVYPRRWPSLAASSAWWASEPARKRRNDSVRSHRPDPARVRTRSRRWSPAGSHSPLVRSQAAS
jgi:hypothetical protein